MAILGEIDAKLDLIISASGLRCNDDRHVWEKMWSRKDKQDKTKRTAFNCRICPANKMETT